MTKKTHVTGRRDPSESAGLRLFVTAGLCLLMAGGFPALAAEQKTAMTGTLMEVNGLVEVQPRATADWVKATPGMSIKSGDQINSGIDGSALLKFANSVTEIKPLTQFVVGRAIESGNEFQTELFLSVGKIVSKADQVGGKTNRFTVTTPTAVAGIRGTQQEISFGEGFGTECKIQDGEGTMRQSDPANLPPAVQMALGVAPAAPPAGAGAEGAGGAVSEAATAAAGGGPGAAAPAVAEALDQWLGSVMDNQVAGEDAAAAPSEEGAPAEDAAAMMEPGEALSFEELAGGEEIVIGDGEEAAVQDATDIEAVREPDVFILENVQPDILPSGTTAAEEVAATVTTEVSDEPVSEAAVENSTSEELSFEILETTVQSVGGTDEEVDLFGQPPSHPTSP
ncbi:FecR domain-containing protein [bacterium]|nr:FecR domain-containing protein [bacterium]